MPQEISKLTSSTLCQKTQGTVVCTNGRILNEQNGGSALDLGKQKCKDLLECY